MAKSASNAPLVILILSASEWGFFKTPCCIPQYFKLTSRTWLVSDVRQSLLIFCHLLLSEIKRTVCSLNAVNCFTEITGGFCRKLFCSRGFTFSVCNNSVTSLKGQVNPQITSSAVLLFVDVHDLQKLWGKFY